MPPEPDVADPTVEAPAEPATEPTEPATEPAGQAAEPEKKEPPEPRRWKVKLSEDEELELTEDELLKRVERASVSTKRLQAATQLERDLEAALSQMTERPAEVLRQIYGASVGPEEAEKRLLALASEILKPALEEAALPAERREAMKMQREAERIRAELEELRREREAEGERHVAAEIQARFMQEITQALDHHEIPDDLETVESLVATLQSAIENDYPLTVDEAVSIVKERRLERVKALLESVPDEAILEDPERARRLAAKLLELSRAEATATIQPGTRPKGPPAQARSPAKREKKRSLTDFFGFD